MRDMSVGVGIISEFDMLLGGGGWELEGGWLARLGFVGLIVWAGLIDGWKGY